VREAVGCKPAAVAAASGVGAVKKPRGGGSDGGVQETGALAGA
jgi:hypothetical protein